ncbi:hypothetical protein [Streptomyces tendae]|uniref:hypothetical protein n=1 Tax=Streptomyces tendae TaxID=1932 RepID=UPI0036C57DCB
MVALLQSHPARVSGWHKLYKQAENELRDPRAPACPAAPLVKLADSLVAASCNQDRSWGNVVLFAASTAAFPATTVLAR